MEQLTNKAMFEPWEEIDGREAQWGLFLQKGLKNVSDVH